ncbi:uncharacterized protein LOC105283844 isoform X2 [Ooceraea biroi]|uniref:uncharacterized protein LOC105283844 isoform X2 n=1 Tax=Ooceraea biroi TaxID=2015173 RepID=UPI000F0835F4|nr:uncharacterized protein LOC105283844 isoform X2 [Ooceraea biroi]
MSATRVMGVNEAELENVLQQIFVECEASMSVSTSPDSTVSIGEDVPVSRIVEYIKNQLRSWSIDNLVELWKCLVAASTNGRVSLQQFKQATKCWITKAQQVPSLQDGNNNAQERVYIIDDADSSMTMDMDKDVIEVELRMRLREVNDENMLLRDELERHEATIETLKLQCNINEKQLDRYIQKCQQLEKENDEQRDKLNEAMRNEKTLASALRRSTKEYKDLLKQLEAAEIEVQAIPSLKDKVEKISKEKVICLRQITKLQEEFNEREDECKQLKVTVTELKDASSNMKDTYEFTIRNLREKNRQLVDENVELQSSLLNGEGNSTSPIPDTDGCCTHSTPYKPEKVERQDSLYAELIASGFAVECSKNESCKLELEEELEQYDTAISAISEQLEKVVQAFVTMRGSSNAVPRSDSQDADAKTRSIEALEHKIAFLLHMATEEITKRSTEDASTLLRADAANPTENLHQFGVSNFHDALARAQPSAKAKTDLWPITPQCVESNKDNDSDPFLRVIKTFRNSRIIDPIVEELNEIIEDTLNSLTTRKDQSSAYGNSRHRSVHTLPSHSQALQPSSLSTEDYSSCQSSETNTSDALFAQGDGLKQEDKKFVTEPGDVPDQEKLIDLEENPREMPRISSILQVNAEAFKIASSEMNSKSSQIPEVSSASKSTSPRRKISVYCRSFDVVAVQDSRENQGSDFAVRQSTSNSAAQTNEIDEKDENNLFNYQFNHGYRNAKNESDSSNDSTPQKQFRNSQLEDEPLAEQAVPRKIHLAPTRLILPQEGKNDVNGTIDCASSAGGREENDNASSVCSSSTFFEVDNCDTLDSVPLEIESRSATLTQEQLTPSCLIPHDRSDSAKFADSEGPHSQVSVLRASSESRPRVERSVDNQMSSREDSSLGSDSECEAAASAAGDRFIDEKSADEVDKAASAVSSTLSRDSTFTRVAPYTNAQKDEKTHDKDVKKRRQRLLIARRSLSEGELKCPQECHCERNNSAQGIAPIQRENNQPRVFPSLTDIRLQEFGIANLSDTELSNKENLNELELQKRYIAFSLCLCTDRVTLPRRVAMSLRQRDQSEKNLSNEVQKMQQDIQDLAPLCTDRESVERVERVRHQLDMIARCAHRVSCVAETLGAVHQELRVSRAVLLADRYLQVLQSRCEKLASNIAETKRILIENNIVIEENSAELGDDLPRIKYRSSTPVNNRSSMMDTVRQRNSVSGRMTLRRPSFTSESPKWEVEKLNRTDSSNSIGELRGIFEQAEVRRSSTEENNNMLRLSHCNSKSVINCTVVDEIWSNEKEETSAEHLALNKNADPDCSRPLVRSSQVFRLRNISWRMMLCGILIFFLGFFVNQTISSNVCSLNGWSIEDILGGYIRRTAAPHPM